MKLYLCEKPSQARDIAAVLGDGSRITTREGSHRIAPDIAVTWCIGHLYELASPEDYDPALKDWRMETLPMIPSAWKLKPRKQGASQIRAIRSLLQQASEVVIATDPDREGEVIAREVLDEMIYRGPVNRLLLSALDPASIRKGLAAIRPGRETQSLYYAGLGRARADWLVGMSLSRAWTLAGRAGGMRGTLSIGRVQTPTLNLVVQRDLAIENFVPVDYWVVEAHCSATEGYGIVQFRAVWSPNEKQKELACDEEGRCTDLEFATEVASDLSGAAGTVTSSKKEPGRNPPPLPFSLSELQQLASRRWGYGAKQTLEIAQSLYEKHKAISYPRTDTGYLPEDQHAEANTVLAALRESLASTGEVDDRILNAMQGVDPARKSPAWNDRKVTAHHGMIPTSQPLSIDTLSEQERNVFLEIGLRYALQFWADHEFIRTSLVIDAAGHTLKASGRQSVVLGWKELFQKDGDGTVEGREGDDLGPVPFLSEDTEVQISQVDMLEKKTKPPQPYTEGTLIKAMTTVASEVRDPEIRKLLREHDGIGTEATRAEIIQTLKKREYIETVKRKLRSTDKGRQLIAAVPEEIRDPGTTALMEQKLSQVESGEMTLSAFLDSQALFVTRQVEQAKRAASSASLSNTASSGNAGMAPSGVPEDLGACPECGKALRRRHGKHGPFIGCSGYPECRYIQKKGGKGKPGGSDSTRSRPVVREDVKCPQCGRPMVERRSARGPFLGCSGFPECRQILRETDTGRNDAVGSEGAPQRLPTGETDVPGQKACPLCGGAMIRMFQATVAGGRVSRKDKGATAEFLACADSECQGVRRSDSGS